VPTTYREFGRLGKHLRIARLAPCVTPTRRWGIPARSRPTSTTCASSIAVVRRSSPTWMPAAGL